MSSNKSNKKKTKNERPKDEGRNKFHLKLDNVGIIRSSSSNQVVAKSKGVGTIISKDEESQTNSARRHSMPPPVDSCDADDEKSIISPRPNDVPWDSISPRGKNWVSTFQERTNDIEASMNNTSRRSYSLTHNMPVEDVERRKSESNNDNENNENINISCSSQTPKILIRKRSLPQKKGTNGSSSNLLNMKSKRDFSSKSDLNETNVESTLVSSPSLTKQETPLVWTYPFPMSTVLDVTDPLCKKRLKPTNIVMELNELRLRICNLEEKERSNTENTHFFRICIDDVQWLGIIGNGGSGCKIWKCKISGMLCATKVLNSKEAMATELEAFDTELKILSSMPRHQNILQYLFHASSKDKRFMVFSYYDHTLQDLLSCIRKVYCTSSNSMGQVAHNHPFSENDIVSIILPIARGIQFLHANNIIHLDLKPGNVFIEYSVSTAKIILDMYNEKKFDVTLLKEIVIADFDVSHRYDINSPPKKNTGTPGYISPELDSNAESNMNLNGNINEKINTECDKKTDIFSFGMILYEIITLHEPFYNMKFGHQKQECIINNQSPELHDHITARYPKLTALHQRCISFSASKRPNISEVCEIIESIK